MRWLVLALAAPMIAGSGVAQAKGKSAPPPFRLQIAPVQVERATRYSNFALPDEARLPAERPGVRASVAISRNATIGIGRFYAPPRRRTSIQDEPVSLQPKKSRRAALGLSLRF